MSLSQIIDGIAVWWSRVAQGLKHGVVIVPEG